LRNPDAQAKEICRILGLDPGANAAQLADIAKARRAKVIQERSHEKELQKGKAASLERVTQPFLTERDVVTQEPIRQLEHPDDFPRDFVYQALIYYFGLERQRGLRDILSNVIHRSVSEEEGA